MSHEFQEPAAKELRKALDRGLRDAGAAIFAAAAKQADESFAMTPEALEELRRKLPAAPSSRFALREIFDVPIYASPSLNDAEIEQLRAAWDRRQHVAVRPIDERAFMYSAVEAEGERERKALALARRREAKQRVALAAVCAVVVLALAMVGFFWG